MAKEKMTWDGAADQKLLLIILATHDIKVDFEVVARSFGPQCTPRAVQERIKKLKIMAKNEDASSPDSTPSKTPTVAAKKAADPKAKAEAKSILFDGTTVAGKKRKTNKGGMLLSSDEGNILQGGASVSQIKDQFGAVEKAVKNEPALGNKRKLHEMLDVNDGNDTHTMVKEEPRNFDGDLSDISAFDPAEDQLLAENDFSAI